MDDGAIMMLTSISAWNRSSAKYLYINLTEEEAAKAQVVVCDTEGTPCMNCLTELLNRVGADRDRRAVQREAAILSKIEQDKQTELEPIRTAVAENKTAIDNQNKAVDEKLAQWNESVKESIEQALQVQNSNWRGRPSTLSGTPSLMERIPLWAVLLPISGLKSVIVKSPVSVWAQPAETMVCLASAFPVPRTSLRPARFLCDIRVWTLRQTWS